MTRAAVQRYQQSRGSNEPANLDSDLLKRLRDERDR